MPTSESRKEYLKQYRINNRERINEYKRLRRLNNDVREKENMQSRQYYYNNLDKIREYRKKYREKRKYKYDVRNISIDDMSNVLYLFD